MFSLNEFTDIFTMGYGRSIGVEDQTLDAEGILVLYYREEMGVSVQFQSLYYNSPIYNLPEWWTIV